MTGYEAVTGTPASLTDGRVASWRREALARQLTAIPAAEQIAVTCSAPPGTGGLGRHVQEIAETARRAGRNLALLAGEQEPARGIAALAGRVPLPQGPRDLRFARGFDRHAASRLPAASWLVAFNGQSAAQQRAARAADFRGVSLVSANSHMRRCVRQHQLALRRYPLEQSWTRWMLGRHLREYEQAQDIWVASSYIRDSFLQEGFAESRLRCFPLTPDPRYDGARARGTGSDRFEIVYVGSLAVHKGVPLLIDAFRRLDHDDLRLVLVGGWGTRGMRRFVQQACAADGRIVVSPGDPLPALQSASLAVHPAYEDGFAYAPAEALVAGVPVIVSEDTGMKDMIGRVGRGLVLPTGDIDALSEAIEAAYREEILAA
jgi:glycosyltransferase involved in cell wall biosynthesis